MPNVRGKITGKLGTQCGQMITEIAGAQQGLMCIGKAGPYTALTVMLKYPAQTGEKRNDDHNPKSLRGPPHTGAAQGERRITGKNHPSPRHGVRPVDTNNGN